MRFIPAQIWIEQEVFRLLDSDPRQVFGEVDPGRFFEHLAEIECAGVDRAGHVGERKVVGLMIVDKLPGASDCGWLGVLLAQSDLIAYQ